MNKTCRCAGTLRACIRSKCKNKHKLKNKTTFFNQSETFLANPSGSDYFPVELGTHFVRTCSLVHGLGRMCFGLVAVGWGCFMQMPGRPNICGSLLTTAFLSVRGPSLRLYHLRPFLVECRRSSRHFGNLLACRDCGPSPGTQ